MAKYLNLDGLSTLWTKIKALVSAKQDKLTAGTGISISGSTISATGETTAVRTTGYYTYNAASCCGFKLCTVGNSSTSSTNHARAEFFLQIGDFPAGMNTYHCQVFLRGTTRMLSMDIAAGRSTKYQWKLAAVNTSGYVYDVYAIPVSYSSGWVTESAAYLAASVTPLARDNPSGQVTWFNPVAVTADEAATALGSPYYALSELPKSTTQDYNAAGNRSAEVFDRLVRATGFTASDLADDAGELVSLGTNGLLEASGVTKSGDDVKFPGNIYANGSEQVATVRYLTANGYSLFPLAGQGITVNTDSDTGAPIILVKSTMSGDSIMQPYKASETFKWRTRALTFNSLGQLKAIGDITDMPIPDDSGTAGYILQSQGPDAPPKWMPFAGGSAYRPIYATTNSSGVSFFSECTTIGPWRYTGIAYYGTTYSGQYGSLVTVIFSGNTSSFTPGYTARVFLNTASAHFSGTANLQYRRGGKDSDGKFILGKARGSIRWDGAAPTNVTLYAKAYDRAAATSLTSGLYVNLTLVALSTRNYDRFDAYVDNAQAGGSMISVSDTNYGVFENSFLSYLASANDANTATAALTVYSD